MSSIRRSLSIWTIAFALLGGARAAHAQNRVDLDDLNIKGELLNDNRLRLSSRDKHQIADRVSYRTNFRREIIDALEIAWPERTPAAEAAGAGQ